MGSKDTLRIIWVSFLLGYFDAIISLYSFSRIHSLPIFTVRVGAFVFLGEEGTVLEKYRVIKNIGNILRSFIYLPVPGRLIRFFPPTFTIRNPLLAAVKKEQKKGKQVAILLFDIVQYGEFEANQAVMELDTIHRTLAILFRKVLTSSFEDKELLLVNRFHGDEYAADRKSVV